MMHVGNNVRCLRESKHLTQHALAKRASMSRPAIANIEAGRQNINLTHLMRIAQALEVTASDILP